MTNISKADLIQDFQAVAQKLGKRPTLGEYNDHGEYSSTPIYDKFESFEALKAAAGFETGEKKISDETLINDLRRVAEQIGRSPPLEVYDEKGEYNFKTLKRRWGSWHDVLIEAGFEPTEHSKNWQDTDYSHGSDGNIEVLCDYCGEPTTKWEHQIEGNENVYCNRRCKGGAMSEQTGEEARSWEGGNVPVECEICGTVDHVRPAKVDSHRFCSQDCMLEWRSDYFTGENHPRWTDSDEYRYYGPNWDEQSQKCRERDNNECQVCGRTNQESIEKWGESLTAHHIIRFYDFDEWRVANQLPNLVAACKACHGYLDSGKADLPDAARERFLEWVDSTDKTSADATARI